MTTRDTPWPHGTPSWADAMVDDTAKAKTFYSGLFGWDVVDAPDSGGYMMCLHNGRPVAGIGPKMGEAADPAAGVPACWTTYLTADSVDDTCAAVTKAGGQVIMPGEDIHEFGRMAIVADAAGGVFGLWQPGQHYGAQIVNEPGAMCWNDLHAQDYSTALTFYADVFGHQATEIGDGQDFKYSSIALPGSTDAVGGIHEQKELPPGVTANWLVWFAVDDVDASAEKVTELGGSILKPAEDSPFGRNALILGPDGEAFAIIKPALPA